MDRIELIGVNERPVRRRRVSWGSIFAGTVIVLAVTMLLSLLGTAIGMFIIDPTSSEPFSGVGLTVGIWVCISVLIGLMCGGFVAGKLAGADGIIHGLVVWGATMIAGAFLVGSLTVGTVRLTSKLIGAAGTVVSEAGNVVEGGVSSLARGAENIFGQIDFDNNPEEMRSDIRQALRRSGVKEFQPEYIRGQYRAISNDLNRTVRRVMANPQRADELINGLGDRLQTRADRFAQNVNKEDVVNLVANNSNMSHAQAEEAVDQYMDLIERGKERISELQENVKEAAEEWDETKQDILKTADKATNKVGWAGVISFIALLLGAVVSAVGGAIGIRKTRQGYEA